MVSEQVRFEGSVFPVKKYNKNGLGFKNNLDPQEKKSKCWLDQASYHLRGRVGVLPTSESGKLTHYYISKGEALTHWLKLLGKKVDPDLMYESG